MLERIEKLESKLTEARARISPDAFLQWKSSATTKALFIQLQIDEYNAYDIWASGVSVGNEEFVRGQVSYIRDLPEVIRELGAKYED